MRKLATIRTIDELHPIDGADFIELAMIDGWQCVVKKGTFQVGDTCIYLEIDSFIPSDNPLSTTFSDKFTVWNGMSGLRVKTMRLRKQLSQGLALPITPALLQTPVGSDVTEELGILKWEIINQTLSGDARGNFPEFIAKTDQERCQNLRHYATTSTEEFEVSLKLHGSSITIYNVVESSPYYDPERAFGVCSRNIDLKYSDSNHFWVAAEKTGIAEAIAESGRSIAIQGELLHPSILSNFEKVKDHEIHIYDVFDIDEQRHLTPAERVNLLQELGLLELHIKVLDTIVPHETFNGDLSKLLEYAEGEGMNGGYREGIVFKPVNGGQSFKAISNKFLLKGH